MRCEVCAAVLAPAGTADEATCKDCDAAICSHCAGLYEPDYDQRGDSLVWCGLALCKPCAAERRPCA